MKTRGSVRVYNRYCVFCEIASLNNYIIIYNDEPITNQLYLDCWVYTTFYLYLCVVYVCWISYKHVKFN